MADIATGDGRSLDVNALDRMIDAQDGKHELLCVQSKGCLQLRIGKCRRKLLN